MDPSKNPTRSRLLKEFSTEEERSIEEAFLSEMTDGVVLDHGEDEIEEKFDMALLNNPAEDSQEHRHYDERDYQSHRRESFPQTHHPLRPLHSRSGRRKHSNKHIPSTSTAAASEISSTPMGSPDTAGLQQLSSGNSSVFQFDRSRDDADADADADSHLAQERSPLLPYSGVDFSIVDVPIVTVTPIIPPHIRETFDNLSGVSHKKVQFEIGGSPVPRQDREEPSHERRRHSRKAHHKYENPQNRLRQGSMVTDQLSPLINQGSLAMPESLDLGPDIPVLADLDKDDLTTHRFADNKGFRRHKFPLKTDALLRVLKPLKYDHQPHEIFVELDVLSGDGDQREWKEAARWIKYEEDVEEGADRWGRPHVASLSFHSLINLRRLIETGVTLLDLEERDLPGVAYRAVEAMVVTELISPEDRAMIMRSLLLKHRHVNESDGMWKFNLRRNTQSGSLTSIHAQLDDKNKNKTLSSVSTAPEGLGKLSRRNSATSRLLTDGQSNEHHPFHPTNRSMHDPHTTVDLSKLSLSNLSEDGVKWALNKESLLRRIPVGAEASIVLVGKDESLKKPIMAFIRLAESSYMPNITELPIPVRFLYILLGPSSFDLDYKEIGRSISTLMSNRHFHEIAYKANDRKDMLKGIHDFLDESIVLPPGDWDDELFPFEEMKEKSMILRRRKEKRRMSSVHGLKDVTDIGQALRKDGEEPDPLKPTRKLFGGMVNDIKRRYPLYYTDIMDGLNLQVLASIIFIYFACVSGAIAFGGILGDKTEKHIGISETLLATAAAGLLFSCLAGQPLIVVGTTGPLLLFDESLYKICKSNGIDFLAFRFWIGMWIVLIGITVVAFDGSSIARYFTRFVQEIFASMIALLFIMEAIFSVIKVYEAHPLRKTYGACDENGKFVPDTYQYPNTALLSTVLCLGTFTIAYSLRSLRSSRYFTPMIRKFLGNFAVPIAIIAMVGVDYSLTENAETEKLNVPNGIETTSRRESWLIDPSLVSISIALLAVVPALLVFILMFMETCICSLIVGKKEMKLRKGGGYYVDILLICLINGGLSTFGGSWVCAATVRAVAHSSSLTVFSTNNPPGEKPTVLGVKEQRLSNFVVSLLLGLSVLISSVLILIPMAVLFGVFLYMGISSMDGIQFFERVSLLLKQVNNHPQILYVRRVRTSKMHLFTVIQILSLVLLLALKFSPIALAIPFILILLVPFRFFGMPKIFKSSELAVLDSKGGEPVEDPSTSSEDITVVAGASLKNGNGISHLA